MPSNHHLPAPSHTGLPSKSVVAPPPHKASIGALLQRAVHAPQALTASHIHTLQRTVGNRAVVQLLAHSHTSPSVIQREGTRKTARRTTGGRARTARARGQGVRRPTPTRSRTRLAKVVIRDGEITSVSFKGVSRPASGRGKQGDHTTAFVTITEMIANAIRHTPMDDLVSSLTPVVDHIRSLSGMNDRRWGPYLRDQLQAKVLQPAQTIMDSGGTGSELGAVLYDLAAIRNQVPGGAIIHATSTGGHDEGYKNARLRDAETRLRNSQAVPYDPKSLGADLWGMFDYHPTKSVKDGTIVNRLVDHINSVTMSYPLTVPHIGGKAYLHARLVAEYKNSIFNKMSGQQARIARILLIVKGRI